MAVAFRSSANSSGAVASLALAKPTGAVQGDVVVAAVNSVSGGTVTPPAGWTQLGTEQVDSVVRTAFFWRLVGASDPSTYTFTSALATFMDSVQGAYSGTGLFVSGNAVSKATTATTFTTSAITTQFANALIVTAFVTQLNAVTWTPPSGMTERQDVNGLELNDVIQVSAGSTGTKAATASASTDAAYLICAIEESPTLTLGSGSYTLSGHSTTLLVAHTLTASSGSYSLSGHSTTLTHGYAATLGSGSYSLSGQSTTLLVSRILTASSGSYALSGHATSLLVSHVTTLGSGSYSLTGASTALIVHRVLAAGAGSYALSGHTATLLRSHSLTAGSGSYALTGSTATLTYLNGASLVLGSGSYQLTGSSVTFVYTPTTAPHLTVFAAWDVLEYPVFALDLDPLLQCQIQDPYTSCVDMTPSVPLVLVT